MKNNIITLPKPPSINHMYGRSGHRTYITDDGNAWILEAGAMLNSQWKRRTPIEDEVSFYVKLYICGRGDIDNYNKALFDLFMKQGVIVDDSQIMFLQIEKIMVKHRKDQKVEVEIIN